MRRVILFVQYGFGASIIDNRRMRGVLFIRMENIYTDSNRTRVIELNNMEIDRESRMKFLHRIYGKTTRRYKIINEQRR